PTVREGARDRLIAAVVAITIFAASLAFVPAGVVVPGMHDRLNNPKFAAAALGSTALLVLLAWRARCWELVLAAVAVAFAAFGLRAVDGATLRPCIPYFGVVGTFAATLTCARARTAAVAALVVTATIMAALVLAEEWGAPMPGTGIAAVVRPAATTSHRGS